MLLLFHRRNHRYFFFSTLKNKVVTTLLILLCLLGLMGCTASSVPTASPAPSMGWIDSVESNSTFSSNHQANLSGDTQTISFFCWHPYFLNDAAFSRLFAPLQILDVNRLYLHLSPDLINTSDTAVMADNLYRQGVEPVFLTGNANWLWSDMEEYYSLVDAIAAYNDGIGKNNPVTKLAIDAECYTQKEWKAAPDASLTAFTQLMQSAKDYANAKGINVIQIIPTHFDEIDLSLMKDFISQCCDEVSLMNYQKETSYAAIWNEVSYCRECNMPVETLFETMQISEKYSVTEDNTYYYDGIDALIKASSDMKDFYGSSVGIGYHHYETLHMMINGTALVELYPYSNDKNSSQYSTGQPSAPGVLWLTDSDGQKIPGYVYWPNGRLDGSEYCYLLTDVLPDAEYHVEILEAPYTYHKTWQLEDSSALHSTQSIHLIWQN